jgi:hypothetical protein
MKPTDIKLEKIITCGEKYAHCEYCGEECYNYQEDSPHTLADCIRYLLNKINDLESEMKNKADKQYRNEWD